MAIIAVPYHLDDYLDGFDVGMPVDQEVAAELPPGSPWQRMAVLYEQVARAVSSQSAPMLVVSGDCTTSLGILAGLQRSGRDLGIVWLDAHADFHTEATTTSGYLGGMPLALAVGLGALTLPEMLGLPPVPEDRVILVDARDTDPGEHVLLGRSAVTRTSVSRLDGANLPDGELYLHIDVDVCDPVDLPGLLYPAPGGPDLDNVIAAIQRVVATGRVAGVGMAATWQRPSAAASVQHAVMRRLATASGTVSAG